MCVYDVARNDIGMHWLKHFYERRKTRQQPTIEKFKQSLITVNCEHSLAKAIILYIYITCKRSLVVYY